MRPTLATDLTFAAVAERFRRLDMTLVARLKDTRGVTWKYGAHRNGAPGQHFYTSLEMANRHAREIAWMRRLENDGDWGDPA